VKRVPQQKVYPVGIHISDNDLAQRRPGSRCNLCHLLEECIRIAEIPFSYTDGRLSERMSRYYFVGELLMPRSAPGPQEWLNVRVAAEHTFHCVREC
jgi:hypothetical protein